MTITMTAKHQITIPNNIAHSLGLKKGDMFEVSLKGNRIELIPVEIVEKVFTDEEYAKLNALCENEKGKEKPVTEEFIDNL
jgi:AbrB family looped-hinge helix DNA binding protein